MTFYDKAVNMLASLATILDNTEDILKNTLNILTTVHNILKMIKDILDVVKAIKDTFQWNAQVSLYAYILYYSEIILTIM